MGKKSKTKPGPAESSEAAPLGRPSGYKPEFAEQAKKLCQLGATDSDLADFFAVSVRTIANWQSKHEDFLHALKGGKEEADNRVERSLYQRAVGYEYDAVKIFNSNGTPLVVPYREKCPPDTTAMIFWLKNRRAQQWRDVQKVEHGGPGDFDRMSDDELAEYVAQEAEQLALVTFKPNGKAH